MSSGNAGMKLLNLFSASFVLIWGLIIGSLWYAVVRGEFTRFATKHNYKDVLLNLNSKFTVCRLILDLSVSAVLDICIKPFST